MNTLPMASRDIRHKAIRAALKIRFPATKFSVRGSRGTGYGWTHIGWTDGPTDSAVRDVVACFLGSHFNGMTDGYDSTGNYFEFQGVRYAAGGDGFNTHRRYSVEFLRRVRDAVGECYNAPREEWPAVVDSEYGAHLEAVAMDRSPVLGGDFHSSWQALVHRAAEDRTTLANA